jgi:hypothetical protein
MNNSFLRARIALAIAQMIGLHRDPKVYNAKPLQAERARRLWWKLYDMDRALSMFMGRPYMIHDKFVDVEMPIPYDDSDISEGPDGTMIIEKSKTGKTIMYYRLYKYFLSCYFLTLVLEFRKMSFRMLSIITSLSNLLITIKFTSSKQGIGPQDYINVDLQILRKQLDQDGINFSRQVTWLQLEIYKNK